MLRKVLRAFIFGGITVALVTIDCVYIEGKLIEKEINDEKIVYTNSGEKVSLVNFVKDIKEINRETELQELTFGNTKETPAENLLDMLDKFTGQQVEFPKPVVKEEKHEEKSSDNRSEEESKTVKNNDSGGDSGEQSGVESDNGGNSGENNESSTVESEPATNPIIVNSCGARASFINSVNDYYNMIPWNVRNAFETTGGTITVRSGLGYLALTTYWTADDGHRYTSIEIDNRNKAKTAIIHELGHFIMWYKDLDLDNSDFYDIWQSEYTNMLTFDNTNINNVNTTVEYFAESFEMLIRKTDKLRDTCPRTYEYIATVLNNM